MASTLTTFDGLMKEKYEDPSVVEKLIYPENPLLAMLEKRGDTGMVGDVLPVPILYGLPQGLGITFSTAQTNATNVKTTKWSITCGDYYGVVQIGDKVMAASRTNQGAFLSNKEVEMDGLIEQIGDSLSVHAWGNGGLALGRIASISSNTLTLETPSDIANFELDMELVASGDGDGSAGTENLRSGNSTVANIDRAAGTVTITVSEITSLAAGDYLFRQSDFGGSGGGTSLKGVQAFVTTSSAPPTLWGVTNTVRATDVERFSGCKVTAADIAGKSMEERIKILVSRMTGRYKAKAPTAGFMHPERFQQLETLMSARGQRDLNTTDTKFGFSKIDIATSGGRIPIYCDRHCPYDRFYAFRMENFWVSSMKDLIHWQNGDGLQILRRATTTDYEARAISYPLLACNAPKNSGVVSLA